MASPPEDRTEAAAHLSRIADRVETSVARARSDWESLKAETALRQAAEADERASALEALIRERVVAAEVSARLAEMAAASPRPPAPTIPDSEAAKRKAKPLWSGLVAESIAEKTRVVKGHRHYDDGAVRQTEATMHLRTRMLGDRSMDEYDGSDAGKFRDLMLRMRPPMTRGYMPGMDTATSLRFASRDGDDQVGRWARLPRWFG